MMISLRKIVGSCLLLITLGGVAGCGHTHSAIRTAPVPVPALPPSHIAADTNPPEPETVQPVPEPPPPPVESQFVHKVRWPRETLFSIARWYTGSGNKWHQLAAANPAVHPKAIHIGDIILIPKGLMKTRLPMPPQIPTPRSTGSGKTPPAKQNPAPVPKIEAFKLYGPIDRNPQPAEPKPKSGLPVPLETLD